MLGRLAWSLRGLLPSLATASSGAAALASLASPPLAAAGGAVVSCGGALGLAERSGSTSTQSGCSHGTTDSCDVASTTRRQPRALAMRGEETRSCRERSTAGKSGRSSNVHQEEGKRAEGGGKKVDLEEERRRGRAGAMATDDRRRKDRRGVSTTPFFVRRRVSLSSKQASAGRGNSSSSRRRDVDCPTGRVDARQVEISDVSRQSAQYPSGGRRDGWGSR